MRFTLSVCTAAVQNNRHFICCSPSGVLYGVLYKLQQSCWKCCNDAFPCLSSYGVIEYHMMLQDKCEKDWLLVMGGTLCSPHAAAGMT